MQIWWLFTFLSHYSLRVFELEKAFAFEENIFNTSVQTMEKWNFTQDQRRILGQKLTEEVRRICKVSVLLKLTHCLTQLFLWHYFI